MGLDHKNFEEILEADLVELQTADVPEGVKYEYKSELYGNSDRNKSEALKDISSFANTAGGHLVIGVTEQEGVVQAVLGLQDVDADAQILRLENLIRDGLEPRVSGVRIRSIGLANGGTVFVVRIPKSWNPPHRVSARNSNRFYARNSAGAFELSVEELRTAFNLAATVEDRIRAFRFDRLAKIAANEGPVSIEGGGRLILHLVPLQTLGTRNLIDPRRVHEIWTSFRPPGAEGMSPRYNFDGFINVRGGQQCFGYVQVFRSGAIEATKAGILRNVDASPTIPSLALDQWIFQVLSLYMDGLQRLDVAPPIAIMVSLEGIGGARLGVNRRHVDFDEVPPLSGTQLLLPEVLVEDFGSELDYQRAMQPAMNALWNAFDFPQSRHFDAEGRWTGNNQR